MCDNVAETRQDNELDLKIVLSLGFDLDLILSHMLCRPEM